MTFLLTLLLYIWPFGQLLSLSPSSLPFTIYYLDLIVAVLFLYLVVSPKRKRYFSKTLMASYTIFLTIATVSLFANYGQTISSGILTSSMYLVRLLIYPSIFIAVKEVGIARLKNQVLASLGIFVVLSLGQYFVFPDMRYLKNIGFDDHYYRLIGSFYDPNFIGAIFACTAIFFIGNKKYFPAILFIVLLTLTFSRASFVCFVSGIIFLMIFQKKQRIIITLVLLGAGILLSPKPFGEGVNLLRTFSIFSRLQSWKNGIILFSQRPLFGWGYNTLRSASGARLSIDNSFILLMATTGAMGTLSFFNFGYKVIKSGKNDSVFLAMIFTLAVHSLFNNSLFYIWILAYFWFILGLFSKD
jgi:O-antigen ligase